jgi:hypothetical protein
MQATSWGQAEARTAASQPYSGDGPATRAAVLTREAAEAVDALFGPWEEQLEASVRWLSALQDRLDAEARRLSGLESELARFAPTGLTGSPTT